MKATCKKLVKCGCVFQNKPYYYGVRQMTAIKNQSQLVSRKAGQGVPDWLLEAPAME